MADGLDLTEMMKRAVQANARFYKGWVDLTLDYVRGMSAILGGEPESPASVAEMDAGSGALVLEGEKGETVRGAFLVTNELARTLSCEFVSSAFNDALGARVDTKPVFEPARIELAPGEQRVIQVSMPIDPSLSEGVGFSGEFSIAGMDGFAVPVVLRRLHRPDHAPAAGSDEHSKHAGELAGNAATASEKAGAQTKRRVSPKSSRKSATSRSSR